MPRPSTTLHQVHTLFAVRRCARLYASLDLLQSVVRMERESRVSVPRGRQSARFEGQVKLVLAPLEAQEERRLGAGRHSSAACGADTGFAWSNGAMVNCNRQLTACRFVAMSGELHSTTLVVTVTDPVNMHRGVGNSSCLHGVC